MTTRTLCIAALGLPLLVACKSGEEAPDATAEPAAQEAAQEEAKVEVSEITVDALAKKIAAKAPVNIYDANGDDVRKKYGTIPGATLLTSAAEMDPAKDLPADKKAELVFYCGSAECMAGPQAAEAAIKAGYENVSCLKAGIKGWTEAGQAVSEYQATKDEKADTQQKG